MKNKNSQLKEAFDFGVLAGLQHQPDRPALPSVEFNETAIRDALDILKPKPERREQCLEDIKTAFALVAQSDHSYNLFAPLSKQANEALAQLLAALTRAQNAKAKLPWSEARYFEMACDLEAGIAFCQQEGDKRKQTPLRKARSSHRQRQAVTTAHYLVRTWLVQRQARSLSKQSAWYKLSAILFGNKNINLLAHMSRYQKILGRKPGSK